MTPRAAGDSAGAASPQAGRIVCHVTTAHDAGDARIFHKECATLAAAGYRVVLVAPHGRRETNHGVLIDPLPPARGKLQRWARLQARAAVAAARQRAALYHIHDPELIPLALLARVLWRKRVVYDMHELYSEDLVARLGRARPLARAALQLALERWPLRMFDLVVFATESLRREMPAPRAAVTLMNLPTVKDDRRIGGSIPWEQRQYDVIHLGSISPPRLSFMLEVARRVSEERPGFKWLFLGIPSSGIEWAMSNYDSDFLDRHVVFRGHVTHLEALDRVRASRIGFTYHPLERRFLVAIPMKVFEYMLMEVPAVSTALPELTRLLRAGHDAILIDSDDPEPYARWIALLLADPERAQAIGRAGRARIVDGLNWEASEGDKLLAAYGDVLER
jgi:glycosyltransferase involved in cell wall biosynthesis